MDLHLGLRMHSIRQDIHVYIPPHFVMLYTSTCISVQFNLTQVARDLIMQLAVFSTNSHVGLMHHLICV